MPHHQERSHTTSEVVKEEKVQALKEVGVRVVELARSGESYTHITEPLLPGDRQTIYTGLVPEGSSYIEIDTSELPRGDTGPLRARAAELLPKSSPQGN